MMKPAVLMPGSGETCQLCEMVITYLDSLLKDNATDVCTRYCSYLNKRCNTDYIFYDLVVALYLKARLIPR